MSAEALSGLAGKRPDKHVTLYVASGCHLCDAALEVVRAVQADVGFELAIVAIDGDAQLEAAYRAHLPVLEIDGERAFTYVVPPEALRARIA
jgi:glutaredoxin